MIHRLHNPVRRYAWGSRTHIARLTGRNLGDLPAAEMWIGAHPRGPSTIDSATGFTLRDWITANPQRALGQRGRSRFGDELPFLMKLLAASQPLSLQVHPALDRAQRRFAEQVAEGLPLDAASRTYPDPSHKPELLYALTRFEGVAGFRDVDKTAHILRGLQLPWLDETADHLSTSTSVQARLQEVVTAWLALPEADVRAKLFELRAAAVAAEARAHGGPRMRRPADLDAGEVARESVRVYSAVVPLVDRYPSDSSVLVTLLLNHVVLAPGQALFIDAGVIHAYTTGFGVELMASSDNVLRAGLTPKHVDIAELLQVVDFSPVAAPRLDVSPTEAGVKLQPPIDEFELLVLDLDDDRLHLAHASPRIVLCLGDKVELEDGETHLALEQGESAFVDAASSPLALSGTCHVAVAQTSDLRASG